MARQHIDYTTSALSPPNAPADDGLDTGSADATAIRPVADGQPAQAAVLKRPSENLRTRTEKIRTELENLKYLSDADRALLLAGPGSITWNGQAPGAFPLGTFQLTPATSLTVRPFLAPPTSIPSRLIICAATAAQVTFRTVRQAGTAPRAYSGANDITIDFQPVSVGTGAIIVTATGTPANNVHVQYDSHPTTYTTVDQTVGNGLVSQFNVSAVALALGLEAVFEGGGTPPEIGFPPPGPVTAALKIDTFITAPEKATRYMSGAADAEKHVIPETQLVTFFSDPLNAMQNGDTVCIRYEDLVMSPTDGGRRQSIADLPENNLTIPAGSLFLLRRFPERLPLAIPIATVADNQLIFLNGRVYGSGESGPLVASGASYQGSKANPDSWADSTGVAQGGPSISFEDALDTIIETLGKKSGTSGASKVGTTAVAGAGPSTFSTTAASVQTNVAAIVGELNVKPSLGIQNTFTKNNTFTTTDANGTAVTGTGAGTGQGGSFASADIVSASFGPDGLRAQGANNSGAGSSAWGGKGFVSNGGDSSNARGGDAIWGIGGDNLGANPFAGNGVVGVGGQADTGGTIGGIGVWGKTFSRLSNLAVPAGIPCGVLGQGGDDGGDGHGVIGVGEPTIGGSGVVGYGQHTTPSLGSTNSYGVAAKTDASSSAAVYAENIGSGGWAIKADASGATGNAGGILTTGQGGSPGIWANGGNQVPSAPLDASAPGVFGRGGAGGSAAVFGDGLGGSDGISIVGRSGSKYGGYLNSEGAQGLIAVGGTVTASPPVIPAGTEGVYAVAGGASPGVKGRASTNNTNVLSITAGVNPAEGPGTGIAGFGSSGSGGGDGVQGFGRSAVGSVTARSGVFGLGSYSQTTVIPGGAGGAFTGGNATVGAATGGAGVVAQGGNGIGGALKGVGVSGTGEMGGVFASNSLLDGTGAKGTGKGLGAGLVGYGEGNFYSPAGEGEGVIGSGAAFGTGVKGVGGSGVTYGVHGIGGGGRAAVYGAGRDGDSPGVQGLGNGNGAGGVFGAPTSNISVDARQGARLGEDLLGSATNARTIPRIQARAASTATSSLTLINKYTNQQNSMVVREYISSIGEHVKSVNADLTSYAIGTADVTGAAMSIRTYNGIQEYWIGPSVTAGNPVNFDISPQYFHRFDLISGFPVGMLTVNAIRMNADSAGNGTTTGDKLCRTNLIRSRGRFITYGDATPPFLDSQALNAATIVVNGNGVRINFTSTITGFSSGAAFVFHNNQGIAIQSGNVVTTTDGRLDFFARDSVGTAINLGAGGVVREFFFICFGA